MPRYKFTLEYDGTCFCGWQRQKTESHSVQQTIENSLFMITHERVDIMGAGRTDSGVHATGQVAHCDISHDFPPHRLQAALNHYLIPSGVSVLSVEKTEDSFHARFSATRRNYIYRICNRRAPLALERKRAWHVIAPLNIEAMQEAAKSLLGRHDFSAFRDSQCQAPSPIKTLDQFDLYKEQDTVIATLSSRSFLHSQVRIMLGTLKQIGVELWKPYRILEILESRDRRQAGPTAPPYGLYLTHVEYDCDKTCEHPSLSFRTQLLTGSC